jgi:imidazolonepropionase-like amidohydrolase
MPTLSLLYLDLPWSENPWAEPVARLLDPADINNPADPETGHHDSEPAHQAAYSVLARSEYILEEAYHRAGARYLAGSGTDVWGTMPGISIHQELEGLVRIGLTPREALASATSNFEGTFAGWGKVGRVRPGYRADLLVLFGDPLLDVVNLRAIDRLILAGELVELGSP